MATLIGTRIGTRVGTIVGTPAGAIALPSTWDERVVDIDPRYGVDHVAGVITNVADQSGNAFHVAQDVEAQRPTLVESNADYGGKPSIAFVGASSQFLDGAWTLATPVEVTVFVVGDNPGVSGAFATSLAGEGAFNTTGFFFLRNTGTQVATFQFRNVNLSGSPVDGTPHIYTCLGQQSGKTIRVDGAEIATDSVASSATLTQAHYFLGCTSNNGVQANFLTGDLARYVVIDGILGATEIAEWETYLSAMYGLELAA